MHRAVYMPKHNRCGASQPEPMRRAHYLEPFLCVDLVGTDDRTYLVVKDLGRGSGQSAKPGIAQLFQERRHVYPERRRPLPYLERSERVNVDVGRCRLHRAADFKVGCTGLVGRNAALHTHFGGPPRPGLGCTA